MEGIIIIIFLFISFHFFLFITFYFCCCCCSCILLLYWEKSQLNGKKKIHAIGTYRYALLVIWNPAELTKEGHGRCLYKDLDTLHNVWGFSPQVQRPEIVHSWKKGRRYGIKDTVLDETQNIQEYISKMAPMMSCWGNSWSNSRHGKENAMAR